jgi:tetratricopeptide (TPR) repeat protein
LREHFVPLSCLAMQAVFVLAFFVTARYRLPSLPLLSIYAAHAGLSLRSLVREHRRGEALRLAGGLALLLLLANHAVGAMPSAHWPIEHFDLALAHLKRSELKPGEAQLREALALDPNFPEANKNLCELLVYAGRAPEAVPACTRAVVSTPDSADLHQQLGVALEASGKRPAAIEEYRRALQLAPGHTKAATALAKALVALAAREASHP